MSVTEGPWGNKGGGKGSNTGGPKPQRGGPRRPGGNTSGNRGGGGSGGGPRKPGGGRDPELEAMLRRSQEKFQGMMGGGNNGKVIALGLAALLIAWGVSGFYRVQTDSVGIEQVFGEWTNQEQPGEEGLHWNWPNPVGTISRPVVTRDNIVTIGFEARGRDYMNKSSDRRDIPGESTMLTGDQNIIDADFIVIWNIKDGGEFLFNVRDPEKVLKVSAESILREVVGQRPFNEILTSERGDIQETVRRELQAKMDEYGTGVKINQVQLLDVAPPGEVADAFNDVQRAISDKERLEEEANAYSNSILPIAKGESEKLRQEAQAYREEVVSRATGDAERFNSVYAAYSQAKDVTKKRLYLETLEEVLQNSNKIVIDGDAGGNGVLPYLPLNQLNKK